MKSGLKISSGLIIILLTSCVAAIGNAPAIKPTIAELKGINGWQIQYTGELDSNIDVHLMNIDLFETSIDQIREFKNNNTFVVCYFSAGSHEDWRPDSDEYPEIVIGKSLADWPGEAWLDIRRLDILKPILENRMDLALTKGCDGVDPDNLDGYQNDTGFNLTPGDQLVFNRFLSEAAHARGLLIGLKNDLSQAAELVSFFDWVITEECFFYNECDLVAPFLESGKPVFLIEYHLEPTNFCPEANQMGINGLHKNLKLDAYRIDCHDFNIE